MPVQQALPTPQPGTAGTAWHLAKKIGNPAKKKKKNRQQRRQPAPATLVVPGGAGSRQWEIQGQALRANKPRTVRRRRR